MVARCFADPQPASTATEQTSTPTRDEGGDAQPSDGDFAVPRRGDRFGRRNPRRGRHRARRPSPRPACAGSRCRICAFPASSSRGRSADVRQAGADRRRRSPSCSKGPIGAASFNNEFGRPNLTGYFRTYEQRGAARAARLSQADHAGRRHRQHRRRRSPSRRTFRRAPLLIQLGGPGMLIGMGGGCGLSMGTGANSEDLDFDSRAARQRGDPAPRAQEVIDRCWELGDATRFSRSTTWARAGSRMPCPRLRTGPAAARASICARCRTKSPACRPREVWCNEAQERYVLAIAPDSPRRVRRALRTRALPVCGRRQGHRRAPTASSKTRCSATAGRHGSCRSCLGKPPRMTRDVTRRDAVAPPVLSVAIDHRRRPRAARAASRQPSPTRPS